MGDATRQAGRFLTAGWYHLVMLNFPVEPAVLSRHVPAGTELDFWRGQTYLSVVGFQFRDVRLLGVPIPFHRHFPEVNLRFYVRQRAPDGWRRGVVFIKEIVPRRMVTWVANAVYNENYVTLPMRHQATPPGTASAGSVGYAWYVGGGWHGVSAAIEGAPQPPAPGSEEEFITEHYWGYVRQRDGLTAAYQVEHPPWRVWPAKAARLDGDMAALYGSALAPSLQGTPASAFVAEGSPVIVRRGTHCPSV